MYHLRENTDKVWAIKKIKGPYFKKKIRKSMGNSKTHVWWSTVHSKLGKIKNHYIKTSKFAQKI